jgi:hypothetical protein
MRPENVIEKHEHAGDFKEWRLFSRITSEFPLKHQERGR